MELSVKHQPNTFKRSNVRYLIVFMDISDETVPVRVTLKSLPFKVDLNLLLKVAVVVIASIGMQDLNLFSLELKRVLLYVFERRVTHPGIIVILQILFD